MTAQNEIRRRLTEELARLQTKNSSYSLRSFAKKLQVSPSALSEILSGKRNLTPKASAKILSRLMVDPAESQALLGKIPTRSKLSKSANHYVALDLEHFHVISDWYYFAILSLLETDGFKFSEVNISKRLGLPLTTVKKAVERLEKLEMIEVAQDRKSAKLTGVRYRIGDDISSVAIRKQHHQNLELAATSLDRDRVEERDFSSMSMAIDPDRLPEAKEMIRKFRRELCEYLEGGKKKEVYKLNVQLFPISQKEQNNA